MTVIGLFFICGPSTVFWRIRSIIVNSIQCFSFRLLSHISEKVFKTVKPALADGDPPTAITFESIVFGVITSCFHHMPAIVGRISLSSLSRAPPMFESMLGFALQASARLSCAVQIVSEEGALCSAFTLTKVTSVRGAIDQRKDGQAAKFLAGKINGAHKLHYKVRER